MTIHNPDSLTLLRQLRERRGLTILELALKVDCSVGLISKLERAKTLADIDSTSIRNFKLIAKALDTTPLGLYPSLNNTEGD